jgi:hypothetical protein
VRHDLPRATACCRCLPRLFLPEGEACANSRRCNVLGDKKSYHFHIRCGDRVLSATSLRQWRWRRGECDRALLRSKPNLAPITNPAKPQRCSGLIGVPARLSASSRGCPVSKLHASLKLKGGSGQPWSGEAQEPRRLLDLDLRPRGESRLNVVQRCSARRLRFWLCDSPVCAIARTRLVAYSAPSSGATCGGSRSR